MSDMPEKPEDLRPESGATPPAEAPASMGDEAPAGVDWRIVAVIGLAVVLLVAAYINKRFYGSKTPDTPTVTAPGAPAGEGDQQSQAPKLTPAQQYARLLMQRRMQTTDTVFIVADRQYILANPAVMQSNPENPRQIAGMLPGRLFDVTHMVNGMDPLLFQRRLTPDGRGMIYAHQIPVVGIGGALKPVLKPCAEVGVEDLHPDEVVVGVHVNGEARAYPVRIMNYHEVINDTLGGKPIVVAWSAFGNAAAAMLRAPDAAGKPREFGSAALILQSAIVLYDLETESLWWPVSRLCVAGKLVGERATPVQTGILPFKSWKLRYPEPPVMMGVEPDLKID